jgi:16S rRNA (uracil1498-N3)-methyltransferase
MVDYALCANPPYFIQTMSIPRIYQNIELIPGQFILLNEMSRSHLIQVLRLTVGDEFIIFNGQGGEYQAVISEIQKNKCLAQVNLYNAITRESPAHIHLVQAMAKGEKMDFIIQKSVELGVTEITPIFSRYSEVRLEGERLQNKLRRWQEIIMHAAQQCGRTLLPKLNSPLTFRQYFEKPNTAQQNQLILHPYEAKTLQEISFIKAPTSVLVGPEGGFSEEEIQLAKNNHFQAVKLGPRILRTETASVAAISILQLQIGDFN